MTIPSLPKLLSPALKALEKDLLSRAKTESVEAESQDIDPSDTSGAGDATDLTGVEPTESSEADDTAFGIAAE